MDETRLRLMEAVARKLTVSVCYNGATITLAPHLIFERHGDLFTQALNLSKGWREGEEMRLGQFKLAGLSAATLLDDAFEPLASYDGTPPREDDTVILAI